MLIAGPNLTLDRTVTIDELRPGEVLRFETATITPGGKGVNVARVARAQRAAALLVSFVPGRTGAAAAGLLADEGIELHSVPCGGELRSTQVVLERSGRVTVMNEPGPRIGEDEWDRYEAAVSTALRAHGILVCSGSLPPGAPDDAYRRLAALARRARATAIVDAAGAVLAAALEAAPQVVVPNLAEAEGLLYARKDETVEARDSGEVRARAGAAAAELVRRGAGAAVVTAGAAGAAVADRSSVVWHAAPVVSVRNPVGAGDSFAAALAIALERGHAFADAVAAGLATAAASVETQKAGEIDPARAAALAAAAPPAEPVDI